MGFLSWTLEFYTMALPATARLGENPKKEHTLPHLPSPSLAPFRPASIVLFVHTVDGFPLTDDQFAILGELVRGDLEVQRRGSFPYAARDVVV